MPDTRKTIENDPRLVLPTERLRAEWIAEMWHRVNPEGRPLHIRGFYYAVVATGNAQLPCGYGKIEPFVNSLNHWVYFQKATVTARWMGLIPFDAIVDNRSDDPVVLEAERSDWQPQAWRSWFVPRVEVHGDDLRRSTSAHKTTVAQPFRLIIWGEKSSLAGVLEPIAGRYGADLYLGGGDISNSHLFAMASSIAEDGREAVIFTFADCDPSGHSMPASLAYKLACMRELAHVDPFEFRVIPVSLAVEQCRELSLPSTPLKEGERRKDKWSAAFGIEQTEIDALATLQPDILDQIAERTISKFYDSTLARRTRRAVNDALAQLADDGDEQGEASREVGQIVERIEADIAELDAIQRRLPEEFFTLDIKQPEPELGKLPDAFIETRAMDIEEIAAAVRARKAFK